jgi:hypothetical protein
LARKASFSPAQTARGFARVTLSTLSITTPSPSSSASVERISLPFVALASLTLVVFCCAAAKGVSVSAKSAVRSKL